VNITRFVAENLRVFQETPEQLIDDLERRLSRYGYHPLNMQSYLYAAGDLPIMLVAHCDTVFDAVFRFAFYNKVVKTAKVKAKTKPVFWDRHANVMWSPDGLGADDRAGVLGILALLEDGYRPHVLFTADEESGGIGAHDFVDFCPQYPDVDFLIELDRQGYGEAVFYDDYNAEFQSFICEHGFKNDFGLFTDISVICPAMGISGVNLSCGFYNTHQETEFFRVDSLGYTVAVVAKMLRNAVSKPRYQFEYRAGTKLDWRERIVQSG